MKVLFHKIVSHLLLYLYFSLLPQWRQLLSLFSSVDPRQFQAHGLSELQEATAKYQEIVKSIQDDPRLLSLLGKRRGQKGFRELQGDALRQCCNKIQAYMVCVYSSVIDHLYVQLCSINLMIYMYGSVSKKNYCQKGLWLPQLAFT